MMPIRPEQMVSAILFKLVHGNLLAVLIRQYKAVEPLQSAGSLLVIPAGVQKSEAVNANINVAYIFARGYWSAPLLQLPLAPKVF